MKTTIFGYWFALTYLLFTIVQCDFAITKKKEKLQYLKRNIVDGVIHFHNDMVQDYAIQTNRPYHLFLLFTTSEKRFKCQQCEKFEPEFTVLAESYLDANKNKKIKALDGHDIFFGIVDYAYNNKVYEIYGFTSIPHLVYVPPDEDAKPLDTIPQKIIVHQENKYNLYTNNLEAEAVEKFVNTKTGAHFSIERSKMFLVTAVVFFLSTFALAFKIIVNNWSKLLKVVRQKKLWMFLSFQIYTLSVSGMVYCIIRGPPPLQHEANGKVRIFSPESRSQFVFEGMVIGAYNIIGAISLIIMAEQAIYIKNPFRRYSCVVICLIIFAATYKLLFGAYKFKNPWYGSHSWI